MQIIYRSGDFIAGDETVLIHGTNSHGMMGAGVSLAVRRRLPFAYTVYRSTYLERGLQLGEVLWAFNIGMRATTGHREPSRIVGNAVTQLDYGNENRRYVDYDAVRMVFAEVNRFVTLSQSMDMMIHDVTPITTVAMPLIGAGLARGRWSVISKIIEDESHNFTPIVYLFDGRMPDD